MNQRRLVIVVRADPVICGHSGEARNLAEVALTRTEFDLLAALASRPGRVLQRETLLREVWQTDWEGSVRLVEAHMSNLRRKLQAAGLSSPSIRTVRGVGYRLVA